MFVIMNGDAGPRVVLLQILMNRNGSALLVDGVFGPKTRAAVVKIQESNKLPPDGIVHPQTWAAIAKDMRESVVDVADLGDPGTSAYVDALRRAGSEPIQLGGMCNGVEEMVSKVLQQAGPTESIALLRITGHGNLGRWMCISVGSPSHMPAGEYNVIAAESYSYIDAANFNQLAPILGRLQPYFASFGSMEHGGCTLGSRPETRNMMKRLADLWRVPVSAGVPIQRMALRLEGPIFTAYPNGGTLPSWSHQFRNRSI